MMKLFVIETRVSLHVFPFSFSSLKPIYKTKLNLFSDKIHTYKTSLDSFHAVSFCRCFKFTTTLKEYGRDF